MLKLHLGCGKRNFGSDWIHIDGANFPHIKYFDVTRLPFKGNEVDVIYACHLLEYFDREEVILLLNEWKRVLKPGGILRLAVPDFGQLVLLYQSGKVPNIESILGPLFGKWKMGAKTIYHKTTYDFDSLLKLLQEVGFNSVTPYDWSKTEHAQFDDHSQAYMAPNGDKENGTLISLNVECKK